MRGGVTAGFRMGCGHERRGAVLDATGLRGTLRPSRVTLLVVGVVRTLARSGRYRRSHRRMKLAVRAARTVRVRLPE